MCVCGRGCFQPGHRLPAHTQLRDGCLDSGAGLGPLGADARGAEGRRCASVCLGDAPMSRWKIPADAPPPPGLWHRLHQGCPHPIMTPGCWGHCANFWSRGCRLQEGTPSQGAFPSGFPWAPMAKPRPVKITKMAPTLSSACCVPGIVPTAF